MPDSPRILIVDDEPQIRRFLRASLQAHDYTVIEADTGKEGVRQATLQKPELVILDLGLPDTDGLDEHPIYPDYAVSGFDGFYVGKVKRRWVR